MVSNHNKCSQGSVEIKSLEDQILSKTDTLQLPKQITDYCLDLLHEELQNESNFNQKIVNQQQGEIRKIDTKIETLFDMRLSGDIDSESYSKRKTDLETQKKELENKITILKESNNTDIYKEVKRGFNLKKEYQEAMEKADIEEKRFLVKQVGSEYTARDKQIHIELKPIYKEVLSLVNSIKSEYALIEPKKAVAMQGSFSDLDRISPLMGAFRRCDRNNSLPCNAF